MLKVNIFRHPKIDRLAAALNIPKAHVIGHMAMLYAYAADFAFDGDLSKLTVDEIESIAGWHGEPGAFVSAASAVAKLLDAQNDGTYCIHDYKDHAPDFVKKRLKRTCESGSQRQPTAASGSQRQPTADNGGLSRVELSRVEVIQTPPTPPKGGDSDADWNSAKSAMSTDLLDTAEFKASWKAWTAYRRQKGKKLVPATVKRQIVVLEGTGSVLRAIETIERSITHGWTGLFPQDTNTASADVTAEPPPWNPTGRRDAG